MEREEIISRKIPVGNTEQGVYFLIQNDEIIYVGSSCNIRSRINTHIMAGKIPFDSFYFIQTNSYQTEEIKYIVKFNPKYNHTVQAKNYSQLGLVKLSFIKEIIKKTNHRCSEKGFYIKGMFFRCLKTSIEQKEIKAVFGEGNTALFPKDEMLKVVKKYYSPSNPFTYQTFISFLEGVE